MEPTPEPVPVAAPRPVELLQAQFQLDIKITKDPNRGVIKTYITNLNITNYDGLFKNIPACLSESGFEYSLNHLQAQLRNSAQ